MKEKTGHWTFLNLEITRLSKISGEITHGAETQIMGEGTYFFI